MGSTRAAPGSGDEATEGSPGIEVDPGAELPASAAAARLRAALRGATVAAEHPDRGSPAGRDGVGNDRDLLDNVPPHHGD